MVSRKLKNIRKQWNFIKEYYEGGETMKGLNNLNDVIVCAINKVEIGDTKQQAVQDISSFVKSNYIDMKALKNINTLPIQEAKRLHEEHSVEFEVNDGIATARFGGIDYYSDNALVG